MADCNPKEAIWITMTQSAGPQVLDALNDPLDGPTRVTKTYSSSTPPQHFRLATPGCTGIYPVTHVRGRLNDPPFGPD